MNPNQLQQSTDKPSALHLRKSSVAVLIGLLILAGMLFTFVSWVIPLAPNHRLLLAPMIGQMEACLTRAKLPPEHVIDPAFTLCNSEQGSAAAVIQSTLAQLGPRDSRDGNYQLGYTLNVPLLKFMVLREGRWQVDQEGVKRMVKTIAQSDRSLILYLFSTHFSSFAPVEAMLATDPNNVAVTQDGQLGLGKHYGMDVYPWTVARTDNSLTEMRVKVIDAFVNELCQRQPKYVRDRIEGITLLGETHHLFPDFEAGMGYGGKYRISDYSQVSVRDFQTFLKFRFKDVSALNAALGGAPYQEFASIYPPSKDIRKDRLNHFWEHIDSYAAGSMPVSGWLAPQPNLTGWVNVYLNGVLQKRVRAGLGRQDVKDHVPGISTANVGWRYELDFHSLTPGIYEVAALAEVHEGLPVLLGRKNISVMNRDQSTPQRIQRVELPGHRSAPGILASFDQPPPDSAYFFNPMAALWREFREQQVVRYYQFVSRPLRHSCLAGTPRYIHQLFPYPNPSWDPTKYAVSASLTQDSDLRLGVSLYGEGSYGESFFDWQQSLIRTNQSLADHRLKAYGVTEFHPLRGMDTQELGGVLIRHRDSGAQFLSFFLEGRGPVNRPYAVTGPTIPFFGESNTQNGSDQLYRSLKELMIQR